MIKALCKKAKGNKGFTLIEVIVVLAILGILALILVPRLGGYTKRAKEKADKATARSIKTAVEVLVANGEIDGAVTFYIKNGKNGCSIEPDDLLFKDELLELIGNGVKRQSANGFKVTVDPDFNVTCEAADDLEGSGSNSKTETEAESGLGT